MRQNSIFLIVGSIGLCLGASRCDREDANFVDPLKCDPYTQVADPIALESVLVVGQDGDGVIYVVDEPSEGDGPRVFVSKEDTLFRQEIRGSGQSHQEGVDSYHFSIASGDAKYFTLLVEINDQGHALMARAPEEFKGSIQDLGDDGEIFTGLDPTAIVEMSVQNLPATVETEYLAQLENDKSMVVMRPKHDWSYEDFRLFYGEGDQLIERRVGRVQRALDGGSTWIDFKVDSKEAQVFFGYADLEWGEAYLDIDAERVPVVRLDPNSEDLKRFSFFCIQ